MLDTCRRCEIIDELPKAMSFEDRNKLALLMAKIEAHQELTTTEEGTYDRLMEVKRNHESYDRLMEQDKCRHEAAGSEIP
jgi:hypothetical protein